jgi:hypothetical protein
MPKPMALAWFWFWRRPLSLGLFTVVRKSIGGIRRKLTTSRQMKFFDIMLSIVGCVDIGIPRSNTEKKNHPEHELAVHGNTS